MSDKVKPPVWYWVVSVVAVLWNALGAMNYLMQAMMTEEMIAALPEDQQGYYENIPAWATAGFAIAVWIGLLASIMLLLRKRIALMLLVISFVGVIVQQIYWVFLSGMPISGGQVVLPISVFLFGLALILMAKNAKDRNWI